MLLADLEEARFVTMLLVCLDGANASLSYASAGHVPGFLMKDSGEIDHVLESSGPPLGLFTDTSFATTTVPLASQHLLILLTDGTTEMATPEDVEFGAKGVLDYVRDHSQDSALDLVHGIYRAARSFAGDHPQQDDATGVVVRVA
jgi:sigma-B regulation protein RsbU (phosphoserine phosphatase)